jgi:hypothetical protein
LAAARPYPALVLRTTASFARPAHDALVWEHGRRNIALVEAGLLAVVLPITDGSGVAGYGVFTTTGQPTSHRPISTRVERRRGGARSPGPGEGCTAPSSPSTGRTPPMLQIASRAGHSITLRGVARATRTLSTPNGGDP